MVWSNPPTAVSELRTMLVACTSMAAAGLVQARFHYPSAAITSDSDAVTPDTSPLVVLAEEDHRRQRYAEGARGLPGGTLTATIHYDTDPGTLETLGRSCADELLLLGMSQGLPIVDVQIGLASEPTGGARAADENKTTAQTSAITLTITYGLTA